MNPFDRPVWNALTKRQTELAINAGSAVRYLPDVSPLAAARDDTHPSMVALAELASLQGDIVLLQAGKSPVPPATTVVKVAAGVQMVAKQLAASRSSARIKRLDDSDVSAMVELATLTEPGPFLARTNRLGAFWGIRVDGRLAAMAGERTRIPGGTEVSGVCTHPDFRGRGYAGALSLHVADAIIARGETPYLHAYASNTSAIGLYASLGFEIRCPFTVTVLRGS